MKKQLAILALITSQAFCANAQDPHFSQYFVSPLTVNPALTGFMDGTARVQANHRSQWSSANNAFTTSTFSLDGIVLQGKIPSTDRFGIGLLAMSDKVADGLMVSNYLSISTAYHKGLDAEGRYSIGVGLQGTYSNRGIDGGRLKFNDQLDEAGVFSQTSAEALAASGSQVSRSYLDMSAGLIFRGRINEKNQFYIGASLYHLAKPKATFMNDVSLSVPMRMTFNGSWESKVSDMFSINLLGMYTKQENASETVVGTIVTVGRSYREFQKTLVAYAGVLYRVNDAVIPYVSLEYYDIRFGFAYDVNTSGLSQATKGQGGVEVSLMYLLRFPPNKKIIYLCPNNPKF